MKHAGYLSMAALLMIAAVVGGVAARHPDRPGRTGGSRAVQVVKLRLTANGTDLATISTPNGTPATMSREAGEFISLTPTVRADSVELMVAVKDPATGEMNVVGRYSLTRKVPLDVSTGQTRLAVEWLQTTTVTVAAPASGTAPCTTCCVICDGTTFCACEVSTSCGHCCCREMCGCNERVA